MTLFCNGCCGDVNHLDAGDPLQGRGYKMAQRVGYVLAAAAGQAFRAAEPAVAGPIRAASEQVVLPRIRISDAQVQWSREVLARAAGRPAPGQTDGLPDELYARQWLQLHQLQDQPDAVEVQVLRLGDVGVVGLPGEVFCELGLAVRHASPARHTLVVELANDAIGYLPPRQAFAEGGYETTPGSTRYEPGAAEQLIAAALRQLNALFAD